MVYQETLTLATTANRDMHDLTSAIIEIVKQSGVHTGIVNVAVIGSTAAVGAVEFEPGLRRDVPDMLNRLAPPSTDYHHEQTWHDGNGHSHLQAALLGQTVTVPVREGSPYLGTWQQLFLQECDVKPRRRTVVVTVLGD